MHENHNISKDQFFKKLNYFTEINGSFGLASIYYHDQDKDFCQKLNQTRSQFIVFFKKIINEFDKVSENNKDSFFELTVDFAEISLISKNVNSLILKQHNNAKLLEIIAKDIKHFNDFLLLVTKNFSRQKIYRDILVSAKKEIRLIKYELNY